MGIDRPWVSNLYYPDQTRNEGLDNHNAYQTDYTFIQNPVGIYRQVALLESEETRASGILVAPNLVLTARHVVENAVGDYGDAAGLPPSSETR